MSQTEVSKQLKTDAETNVKNKLTASASPGKERIFLVPSPTSPQMNKNLITLDDVSSIEDLPFDELNAAMQNNKKKLQNLQNSVQQCRLSPLQNINLSNLSNLSNNFQQCHGAGIGMFHGAKVSKLTYPEIVGCNSAYSPQPGRYNMNLNMNSCIPKIINNHHNNYNNFNDNSDSAPPKNRLSGISTSIRDKQSVYKNSSRRNSMSSVCKSPFPEIFNQAASIQSLKDKHEDKPQNSHSHNKCRAKTPTFSQTQNIYTFDEETEEDLINYKEEKEIDAVTGTNVDSIDSDTGCVELNNEHNHDDTCVNDATCKIDKLQTYNKITVVSPLSMNHKEMNEESAIGAEDNLVTDVIENYNFNKTETQQQAGYDHEYEKMEINLHGDKPDKRKDTRDYTRKDGMSDVQNQQNQQIPKQQISNKISLTFCDLNQIDQDPKIDHGRNGNRPVEISIHVDDDLPQDICGETNIEEEN